MVGSVQGLVRTGQTFGGTLVVLVRDVVMRTWPEVPMWMTGTIEACQGHTGWYVEIDRGQVGYGLVQRVFRVVKASSMGW